MLCCKFEKKIFSGAVASVCNGDIVNGNKNSFLAKTDYEIRMSESLIPCINLCLNFFASFLFLISHLAFPRSPRCINSLCRSNFIVKNWSRHPMTLFLKILQMLRYMYHKVFILFQILNIIQITFKIEKPVTFLDNLHT